MLFRSYSIFARPSSRLFTRFLAARGAQLNTLGFRRSLLAVGAVSSVIFSVVLDLGLSDNGAGIKILLVLLVYTALQLGLLLFFLFDIFRVGWWRRKVLNLKGRIILFVMIGIIVWGAICAHNIVML